MSSKIDLYPEGFRKLLQRLTAFKVAVWAASSSDPDLTTDREVAALDEAHVVSSLNNDLLGPDAGRHKVVIDIDHPTYLVRSSTPGHYHLYVDVPGGIPWSDYSDLLVALAACGVIEEGYMRASIERGHSDVRLPWIKKGQET